MQVFRGRVVTPTEIIDDGALAAESGTLTYVGTWAGAPAQVRSSGTPSAPEHYLLPGLIDVHNHGGGGVSFPDTENAADVARGADEHRGQGTARMLASLVTASAETLRERVSLLADAADDGIIAGIHLEGPFISHARCGAQNPAHIIPGDAALTRELIDLGRGHVRTMTIAPETPNLAGVLEALVEGGAVPSFGHTDTDEATMREAIAAGVAALAGTGRRATVTHLFNGMRPIHHRLPGPVPAALAAASRGEVIVELIGDGVHLHPGIVRDVFELVGANNIALITDAMAATGMADGEYRLGSLDVVVADGVARLAEGGSIAGGTAHLLDVVRTTVEGGVPLVDAVRAAATVPASIIDPGAGFGALEVGKAAQVVRVDEQLRMIDGAA